MSYMDNYNEWLASEFIDEATKEELRQIANDEKEIEDRFYRDLEFGTGGLRGVIGAGTNRMNIYTMASSSCVICCALSSLMCGWVSEWLPISCPASKICLTRCGYLSTQ